MNDRTWKFVPRTRPSGAGVVHGRLAVNEFIPRVSIKNLKIHTFAIGAKINGMKKIGFNTSGAPNKIGSFTPKNVGTTEARPMARLRLDLHNHINMNGTTRVAPVALTVSPYDRAAPHGTGNIKAGLNYAMSLYPTTWAHEQGFADSMYLDSGSRTYVEESSGANFLFVDKEGTLVIPQSYTDSILPSITRRSLATVAKDLLGMKVIERPVRFDELDQFVECGMCGTAAVISPVGKVVDGQKEIVFGAGMEAVGPVMSKLRNTLTSIQSGEIEAPEADWICKIC